jgi:intracellular sulfur oxidation DsrE/DsrF family protein
MQANFRWILAVAITLLLCGPLHGNEAPWGRAAEMESDYSAQKVVYDLFQGGDAVDSVLDRASFLSMLNDADPFDHKIVVVIHGDAIPYFAVDHYAEHREVMARAQSLSVGDIVEYRLCGAAARMRGFEARDFHGFVNVVPMADAEIVKLQQQGFAYMQ